MTDFGPIPDGTNWVDAYGRPWVARGTGLILWEDPTLILLGEDPQKMFQDTPYVEAGATASDASGVDLTASIVVDSSALDPSIPGSYTVTYTVTDQYGVTVVDDRTVEVLDLDRPDVRETITGLLRAGMPNGVYVYDHPAEQITVPAVVVGSMSWIPDRMSSLQLVQWTIQVRLILPRTAPDYSVVRMETLSLKAARILLDSEFRVEGFDDESDSSIGGSEYLTGTLSIIYNQAEETQ
jgi:hypothetical protein